MPRAPLRWRRTPRSCLVMSAGLARLSLPKRKSHLPKCLEALPLLGRPRTCVPRYQGEYWKAVREEGRPCGIVGGP
jgi:hypothetical protein